MPDSACLPRPVRSIAIVLLASLLSLLSPPAARSSEIDVQKPKPPKPAGFPVVPGVYRLDGTDPNLGTADLEPLRGIIGGAPVVALGESVHTSGGYYEMKHRIFRFLVEKMGFRVFAIENNWEWTDSLGHYVQTCSGTSEEAMSRLYGVWKSTEVRDLVEWMCAWNRSHPKPKDRLHLFGFDTQQPEDDGRALLAFLARIGVGPDHAWAAGVRVCDGVETYNRTPLDDGIYLPCTAALDAIGRHFDQNARQITRQTSAADLAWARIRLTGLRGWQGQRRYVPATPEFYESRDAAMAYVFRSIRQLRHPKLRTAIWAHNVHIWESPHPTVNWASMMGAHLRAAYGRGYVTLGLVGSSVEIDSPGFIGCDPMPAPPADSVEAKLEGLGTGGALLADLVSPARPPFFPPGQTYDLYHGNVEPRLYFDGIIWLQHSPPMTPIDQQSCR